METHEVESQDPASDLKAERVQQEIAAGALPIEEPFQISLKAERVQEPSFLTGVGGTVSLAYELSFNQMRAVTVELAEPQIVVNLFATGGQEAA